MSGKGFWNGDLPAWGVPCRETRAVGPGRRRSWNSMTCNKGFRLCRGKLWSWDDPAEITEQTLGLSLDRGLSGGLGDYFWPRTIPRGGLCSEQHIKQCTHQLDPSTSVLTGVWTGPQSFQYRRCLEPFSHCTPVSKGDNPWPHRRGNLQVGGVSFFFPC